MTGNEIGLTTLCEDLIWLKRRHNKLVSYQQRLIINLRDLGGTGDESACTMVQFLLQRKAVYHTSCRTSKFHNKKRQLSSKVPDTCPTTPTRSFVALSSEETTPSRSSVALNSEETTPSRSSVASVALNSEETTQYVYL